MVAQMMAGAMIPVRIRLPLHAYAWFLLTDLVIAGVLGCVALRSQPTGIRLGVVMAAIPLGIAVVNLIEGAFFLSQPGVGWGRIAMQTILGYVLVAPAWALIFGRMRRPQVEQPVAARIDGTVWKFVACDVAYLVLYYTAGIVIFPFVRDFYATQHIPPIRTIVALQLLVRGPVFVFICISLMRMLHLPPRGGAVATGLAFTLLSSVALIAPNPFFPDSVRWVHFGEVITSNFIFGTMVGWIWATSRQGEAEHAMKAAA
jgi:hypothetical protein